MILTALPSFLKAAEFSEDPRSAAFRVNYDYKLPNGEPDLSRSSTLFQEVKRSESGVLVQEYRFESSRRSRVRRGEPKEISMEDWNSYHSIASQIRFRENNLIEFRNRPSIGSSGDAQNGLWQKIENPHSIDLQALLPLRQEDAIALPFFGEHCEELELQEAFFERAQLHLGGKAETETNSVASLPPKPAPSLSSNPAPQTQNVASKLNSKAKILENLQEDFDWWKATTSSLGFTREGTPPMFDSKRPSTKEAAQRRSESLRTIIQKMAQDPRFQGEEGRARADRLFLALTLYGEFGGSDNHLTNAHLFWAAKSIDGRLSSEARRNRFAGENMNIGINESNFQGGRMAAVLSPAQYSAWNFREPNETHKVKFDEILGNKGGPRTNKVLDFVAAYDAGLLEMKGEDPKIDHYVSPYALSFQRSDYPGWWHRMDQVYISSTEPSDNQILAVRTEIRLRQRLVKDTAWRNWPNNRVSRNQKKELSLPAIVRLDQNPSLEEHVNPLHFEGGRERR